MSNEKLTYFSLLKEQVIAKFQKNHSVPNHIAEWSGEMITLFQEDLLNSVKASVSEKWFYTYFKNTPEKLPRIDMLNLLSQYIEEENWNTFIAKNKIAQSKQKRKISTLQMVFFILPFIGFGLYQVLSNATHTFEFCFIDHDTGTAITQNSLDILIFRKDESPVYLKTDANGCFRYETKEKHVVFQVASPYHKTDTIYRTIHNHQKELVKVQADEYAMMLYHMKNGNKKEWLARRKHLQNIIANDAQIFEVFPGEHIIELYSKEDFINKLTLPTNGLKNIEILKKVYENGQLVSIKFMVK